MRYAIFTDIHANLEALEAVLARIDELAQQEPIDQIWFLGDLVGYGPNPNECIDKLRERTDVIIAGNHDWAAVGKLDLEDFSEAARISALWTAEALTEEHRTFLANLPERLELDDCTLVHGSPYGPLWEYLTSEVLAERSFQHFTSRFCFVGHTHVPIIFQQPDTIANTPTTLLGLEDLDISPESESDDSTGEQDKLHDDDGNTEHEPSVTDDETNGTWQELVTNAVDAVTEIQQQLADEPKTLSDEDQDSQALTKIETDADSLDLEALADITPEETILSAEERLNEEIEELLALLGLSQSMVQVTNEMVVPPEGPWQAPENYRAIVNPGGVGQPRDGDARAAFMIYDTEAGFTFYRIPYAYEKTQEKIIKAKLPPYLATRLAYGR